METGSMINLNAKERKQICNIVKKSYGINTIGLLEDCIEDITDGEIDYDRYEGGFFREYDGAYIKEC